MWISFVLETCTTITSGIEEKDLVKKRSISNLLPLLKTANGIFLWCCAKIQYAIDFHCPFGIIELKSSTSPKLPFFYLIQSSILSAFICCYHFCRLYFYAQKITAAQILRCKSKWQLNGTKTSFFFCEYHSQKGYMH